MSDPIEKQLKKLTETIGITAQIEMLQIQIFRMNNTIKTLECELDELNGIKKEETDDA